MLEKSIKVTTFSWEKLFVRPYIPINSRTRSVHTGWEYYLRNTSSFAWLISS